MALIQIIIAFVLKQAGRIVNTAFGWATMLLFGKVPAKRQTILSAIGLMAGLWLIVLSGIAFPDFGTFLLSFVRLPSWIDRGWVRLAMLAATLLLPLIVGVLAWYVVDPEDRPRGRVAAAKALVRGFPLTAGLALTLAFMFFAAPLLKLRDLFRWWSSAHVPVVIDDRDYAAFVGTLQGILREQGLPTKRRRASFLLNVPTRIIGWFARGWIDDLVARDLTMLAGTGFEVVVHPSDLAVHGKEETVLRVRTCLLQRLAFTSAHQTWTKEAQELEDALVALWRSIDDSRANAASRVAVKLNGIQAELDRLEVSFDEWEVLFRQKLLVERAFLWRVVGEHRRLSTPEALPQNQ